MFQVRKLLRTEIPRWPFQLANLTIAPLAIMFGGCYRVWATATSPFEETLGIMAAISLALLWAALFGSILVPPQAPTRKLLDVSQ